MPCHGCSVTNCWPTPFTKFNKLTAYCAELEMIVDGALIPISREACWQMARSVADMVSLQRFLVAVVRVACPCA